jgi:protein O-GlcNAcase/histone acetyltransferase
MYSVFGSESIERFGCSEPCQFSQVARNLFAMAEIASQDFLAGVIEGFYGEPWSQAQRVSLFDSMSAWGLNTYFYAPKDDLKHRVLWRELYDADEVGRLAQLIDACQSRKLNFIYGLSPGLTIRYAEANDHEQLRRRCQQMLELDCHAFCLLFDDIPDQFHPSDRERYGSLGAAQAQVTNSLFRWARERSASVRFYFCPTAYCGRMAKAQLGGENYLATVGELLAPEIEVFWTGPEIISEQITVDHAAEVGRVLRRKPVIWDNLHANDYDGRRFYCGPYAGRPPELRAAVAGILSNPNNEFPLNYVPLKTLSQFVRGHEAWDARQAYLTALSEWITRFETVTGPLSLNDLILFGDCYYLPHHEGSEANSLFAQVQQAVERAGPDPAACAARFLERSAQLRAFCARLTELKDRELFYALNRRAWDLREELDLLTGYLAAQTMLPQTGTDPGICHSDFHLPGTFRGGFVSRLQRLLIQLPGGGVARADAPRARPVAASELKNKPPAGLPHG